MPAAGRNVAVSIGIIAWNEQAALPQALESLFAQTLFGRLAARGERCEVLCVANGCTDKTVEVAEQAFATQTSAHPWRGVLDCHTVVLQERSKFKAWNRFVHRLSAREARCLILMDADIFLRGQETLWRLVEALETCPLAEASVDQPRKSLEFKQCPSWWERVSLATSRLTHAAPGQLCAQLYCIRSETARRIYLPADLVSCEDGFIKAMLCTGFLSHAVETQRICVAPEAEHVFAAYTSPKALLRNQKRQVMGQTLVHVLVDQELRAMPPAQRLTLAAELERRDRENPPWLKQLMRAHLHRLRFRFWRLYPGLVGQRFFRLKHVRGWRRLICLPAACAGTGLTLLASVMAYRALSAGCTDYWPGKEDANEAQKLSRPADRQACASPLRLL